MTACVNFDQYPAMVHELTNTVLRVNAIHRDVDFTIPMRSAVHAEIEQLAAWLGLTGVA